MAEIRKGVKNTTTKAILRSSDGLFEMVEERVARFQLQMVRSQSADISSGFVRSAEVDDAKIAIVNLAALEGAVMDAIGAMRIMINGAKNAHHDYEEAAINIYDQPGGPGGPE